ncbi:glycosyltransferase family 9 protein [Agrobacterium tumefaciens]|uniref:glycosyltransferase family 9 protein n=1 Tax=Agrobacterium tumefaciens TaxID=358 RepID=UPI0015724650|nr:glycosyltransferase family 9 protein [Agrobacterium tumefaciens]NTE58342.1 glycosyltransferase family 9 protein [Agrobacterium tumefaciens]NTE69325.1 glycosyltransferase family 9 protein [Agrobacterium tumefaciens]NTE69772.1 glycosyltransferase family 9 protein [Agrobacterium tumefaciens]
MNESVSYEAFEAYLSQQRCPKYSGLKTYEAIVTTLAVELPKPWTVTLLGPWSHNDLNWIKAQGWTTVIAASGTEDSGDSQNQTAALVMCRLSEASFDPKTAYQIVSKIMPRLSAGGVLILEIEKRNEHVENSSKPISNSNDSDSSEQLLASAAEYLGFSPVETRYFPKPSIDEAEGSRIVAVISRKQNDDMDHSSSAVAQAVKSAGGYRSEQPNFKPAAVSEETVNVNSREVISAMRDWRSQSKMSADVIAELSSAALEAGSVSHRLSKAERRIRRLTWQAAIFLPLTYPLSMMIAGVAGLLARMKEKKRKGRFDTKKKLPSDQREVSERQVVTTSPQVGYFTDNNEPRILIVKLDHIGDFILSLPAIRLLKEAWPHGHYTIVCSPTNSGLAKACGYFDEVREYNFFAQLSQDVKKADMSKFSKIRDAVGEQYDIAIDLRHDQDTRPVLAFIDAKIKAGYQTHGKQFVPLDISLPPIPERSGLHKSPHNIRRLMLLCSHVVNSVKPLMFDVGAALVSAGDTEFPWAGEEYAILAPGGGTLAKKWPVERFAELATRLTQTYDLKIVVLGGTQEKEYGDAISRALPEGRVLDLTGGLPLTDMAKVASGAKVFVGSDTGATQLSALLGTPTVAVFSGVADVNLWQPIGAKVEVVRRPIPCSPCYIAKIENCVQGHACMNDIHVEHVYRAVESLILATK